MPKKAFEVITIMNNGEEHLDLELIDLSELKNENDLSHFLLNLYRTNYPERAKNIKSINGYELKTIADLNRFGYQSFSHRTRGHCYDSEIIDASSYDFEKRELIFTAKISLATFSNLGLIAG